MAPASSDREGINGLVQQLSEMAIRVEDDDLPLLSRMHSTFEALVSACEQEGNNALAEQMRKMSADVEHIILEEVDDTHAALEQLVETINKLTVDINSITSSESDMQAGPSSESQTELEVDQRQDQVFDEPVQHESADSPPAAPASGTSTENNSSQPGPNEPVSDEPAYVPEPLLIPDSELDFLQGFVEEAGEHIEAIEAAVLEVERDPEDTSKVDDLFRPFHTIKGASGFLNLRDVNSLTHEAETLLDQCRKGQRVATSGIIDIVFDVVDILKTQFSSLSNYISSPTGQAIPMPPWQI